MLEVHVDAKILNYLPEVERALVTGFEEDLREAAQFLRDAAQDWLEREFGRYAIGQVIWEEAIVLWQDGNGLHIGVDFSRIPLADDMLAQKYGGALPRGFRRLNQIPRQRLNFHERTRQSYLHREYERRALYREVGLTKKPQIWLANAIGSFADAMEFSLEDTFERAFENE